MGAASADVRLASHRGAAGAPVLCATPRRADQRRVLRDAEPRARGYLRPPQHHQLHARGAVHDGRVLRLVSAELVGDRLLAGADHRADRGRHSRHRDRAVSAAPHRAIGSPLRTLADLRPGVDHRGHLPPAIRLVGPALHDPAGTPGRAQSRLHVSAELPRLGHRRLACRVPRNLVCHRAHSARGLSARRDREPGFGARLWHRRAAHGDIDLWRRCRAGGARRRHGGADLPGEPLDGQQHHHRRVRRRRDRRDGLDPRRDCQRLWLGAHRGLDQSVLPRGLEHGHFRHHGLGTAGEASRLVRADRVSAVSLERGKAAPVAVWVWAAGLIALAVIAPFFFYPVFLMKALCMALFACAFNLLLGYAGLLSFGHAAFFGSASYIAAHAAKNWGLTPELAILAGVTVAAALGFVFGSLAIRRQGIYFAMVTLAFAQMVFFFCLQARFTGGEDGIQAVPRGYLFGVVNLGNTLAMYYFVLAVFLFGFGLIVRTIHSPFGQIMKAIRENEPRAISLGYDSAHYKLLAFILSAALAGLAGSTKALVFQFASLTDVDWTMSGEVVLMTLLGGIGTILGPVVGAFILTTMENYLAQAGSYVTTTEGAIFVLWLLTFGEGIVGVLGPFALGGRGGPGPRPGEVQVEGHDAENWGWWWGGGGGTGVGPS